MEGDRKSVWKRAEKRREIGVHNNRNVRERRVRRNDGRCEEYEKAFDEEHCGEGLP